MTPTQDYIKERAVEYVNARAFINPYEAYEGFIAGFNECMKTQNKIMLQKIQEIKNSSENRESFLQQELKKEKEKNQNAGPGNNSGNGNTNPGGGGNNGNSGNNGNGNGNNGNGNGNKP